MVIQEVRVAEKDIDLKGKGILQEAKKTLGINGLKNVRTARVYRLEGITESQAKILREMLFCENITQISTTNRSLLNSTPHLVEVGYKPGVMNPETASIIKSAKDLGINLIAADSSTEYGFYGKLNQKEIDLITEKLLMNKVVERVISNKPKTLILKGKPGKTSIINMRKMNDSELLELSKDKLFLNLQEMKIIQNYFLKMKRDPTDCELETIAQTWSEHSGHKTFNAKLIEDLLKNKIDIHYISNITGHGLRKIMRARQNYTYIIEKIFPPQEVFLFIQKNANLSDYEMYQTFNMGMDYSLFIPEKDVEKGQKIVKKNGFQSIHAGYIEKDKRQVTIKPKNIIFKGETLNLR